MCICDYLIDICMRWTFLMDKLFEIQKRKKNWTILVISIGLKWKPCAKSNVQFCVTFALKVVFYYIIGRVTQMCITWAFICAFVNIVKMWPADVVMQVNKSDKPVAPVFTFEFSTKINSLCSHIFEDRTVIQTFSTIHLIDLDLFLECTYMHILHIYVYSKWIFCILTEIFTNSKWKIRWKKNKRSEHV